MFNLPEEIVVFDTEYTSWDGAKKSHWGGSNEYREIVQIGAVRVETENFKELDSFLIFVKPEKNPVLSDYLKNLTGIRQHDIDEKGVDFASALASFLAWGRGCRAYSWGNDAGVLQENVDMLGEPSPFDGSLFCDIRPIFRARGIDPLRYISSTIVEAFGEKPSRRGHDALNDARTIVDALALLAQREGAAFPPAKGIV